MTMDFASLNRNGPLSPMSASGSEWSGITHYKNPPNGMQRSASNPGGPGMNGGMMANPSPPSSIGRSSSQGNNMYDDSPRGSTASRPGFMAGRRDTAPQEEAEFAVQHAALKKLLDPSLSADKNSAKAKKARDKLLRLTKVQFQELSTDVYDELQRRQGTGGDRLSNATTLTTNTEAAATPYLLPKNIYHPKRNQARQKLSTLPTMRFRDLATDVFFELERRYPQFAGESISRGQSPANSMNGRQQPPTIPEERNRSLGPNSANNMNPNSLGRPLPKTFQSNTVVPNKSTMVEDTDDGGDDGSDYEAFGLEDRLRGINGGARKTNASFGTNGDGRDSMASVSSSVAYARNDADKKIIADYQSQVAQLQQKIDKLESSTRGKDDELQDLRAAEKKWREDEARLRRELEAKGNTASDKEKTMEREFTELKLELDEKLADAQNLNLSLEDELRRVRAEKDEIEQRNQNISRNGSGGGGDGGQWQSMYEDLEQKYEDLQEELREQQEITDEVRSQATAFLQEMKGMSQSGGLSYEQQEKHHAEVNKLQEEVKEWKNRYAKVRTQLRAMKSASIGLQGMLAMNVSKDNIFHDPNGKVNDILVTRFQVIIDDLLRTARLDPKSTMNQMQSVVVATKNITKCIDEKDDDQKTTKLKERVSATANNLVTAIRNHSMGEGLSPVSILDAAASHLNAAIVEFLRVAKIRPTPAEELEIGDIPEEDEQGNNSSGGLGGGASTYDMMKPLKSFRDVNGMSPARTSGDSIYSSSSRNSSRYSAMNRSSPRLGQGSWGMKREKNLSSGNALGIERAPAFGVRTTQSNVEELKMFLITQTNGVIECIQRLLHEIRSGESNISDLRGHIDDIAHVVGKVIQSTETSMSQTGNTMLRERADWIVKSLTECRNNMLKMKDEQPEATQRAEKDFNSRLAGHCFAMAKETKELVTIVEDISNDQEDGDLR